MRAGKMCVSGWRSERIGIGKLQTSVEQRAVSDGRQDV
jgi:hypothetical protein